MGLKSLLRENSPVYWRVSSSTDDEEAPLNHVPGDERDSDDSFQATRYFEKNDGLVQPIGSQSYTTGKRSNRSIHLCILYLSNIILFLSLMFAIHRSNYLTSYEDPSILEYCELEEMRTKDLQLIAISPGSQRHFI
jgi:hypothetical protein